MWWIKESKDLSINHSRGYESALIKRKLAPADVGSYEGDGLSPAAGSTAVSVAGSTAGVAADSAGAVSTAAAGSVAGTGASAGGGTSGAASTAGSGPDAGISASVKTGISADGSTTVAASSPSAAGFSPVDFFSGFGGLGAGFLAVSIRPSANSITCP